ncbi:MAG: hypothetical protein DWQ01_02435 [Planctomycetota bacterium]|nr:MAG: hypothetical protein DWQ01_02435 [Planctomycetota bacterium]
MHRTPRILILALFGLVPLGAIPPQATPSPQADDRPRILITNDNGIDDPKLIALARAFADRAETWVVAPAQDQSGSSTYLKLPRTGSVAVERRDLGPGIEAFAVDGFPGDCVMVGAGGIMKDRLPTLVVSGINGGPNLGADWLFSGTIGAARVAALAGIPAIAVSGLDDDVPGAVEAAVDWVVRFAEHRTVRELEPGEYLTVSLPPGGPTEVKGVKVADRAPLRRGPILDYDEAAGTCKFAGLTTLEVPLSPIADESLHADGMVVVVPMHANEVNSLRFLQWTRSDPGFPSWSSGGPER